MNPVKHAGHEEHSTEWYPVLVDFVRECTLHSVDPSWAQELLEKIDEP